MNILVNYILVFVEKINHNVIILYIILVRMGNTDAITQIKIH